jgi:uncharacterized membrane protein
MTLLIIGLLLWSGTHLFKRLFPTGRNALGKLGKPVVAVILIVSVSFMVIGYSEANSVELLTAPAWAWHLNNGLMFAALFLLAVSKIKGVVRSKIRHPMLTAVAVWAAAHLLINSNPVAFILFGGLGLWSIAEIIVINRADGPWARPEIGLARRDLFMGFVASIVYVMILEVHEFFGRSATLVIL